MTGSVLGSIAILLAWLVLGTLLALFYRGLDKKLVARMQGRHGPTLFQPFYDVVGFTPKETIVPKNAVAWIFNGAPFMALAASLALLVFVPTFSPAVLEGDLILVWYLLLICSLALVVGGFASGSPYATIGAQREMVLAASYEMPLAITGVAIAYVLNSFSLDFIFLHPVWGSVGFIGAIGFAMLFLVMLAVIAPELSKIPFDSPEAETELAGGVLAEYSGRNLCFFFIADSVKAFALCSLVVVLFFPYGTGSLGSVLPIPYLLDSIFFLFKVLFVMFASLILVRAAFARLRIEQASRFFLYYVLFFSLVGLLLVMLDKPLALMGVVS